MLGITDPFLAVILLFVGALFVCSVCYVVLGRRGVARELRDVSSLSVHATWSRRWISSETRKDEAHEPVKGTLSLREGTCAFTDTHGEVHMALKLADIKKVRGYFFMLGGPWGGTSGIYEVSLRIIAKQKQQDLLSFSWAPHGRASGQKLKTWLAAFRRADVPVSNDTYLLVGLLVLVLGGMITYLATR